MKMAILRPMPVESSRFTWSKGTGNFVAEASELGLRPGQGFGRVYDDACDEGLTLVSSKYPGKEIVFVVNEVERDREGDTLCWKLIPANLAERNRVKFGVTVFND
jgi:hypothetical protein